ncbi:MAG: RNA polymerase sigma-70 factor (ECF subfamily) [Verrucomicrobiales bacterium]
MISTLQNADDFEALLEAHREPLRRFLVSLTANQAAAEDLAQETCLVLWRKRELFEPGTNFKAWAFQIAFYTVKNYRRKQARAKELSLPDEGLLDKLAYEAEKLDTRWDEEVEHLPHCLSKLRERNRDLVTRRYMNKTSVQELADERGMTPNAMSQALFRIKRALRKCVEKQLNLKKPNEHGA